MSAESIDDLLRRAERRIGRPLAALYRDEVQGYYLRRVGLPVPREELGDMRRVWVAAFGGRDEAPTLRYGTSASDVLVRAAARRGRRNRPRRPRFTA